VYIQLNGMAVWPLRCIACRRSMRNNDRVVSFDYGRNMVAIPGQRETTCEATFQDASGCVNIDLVTHDEGVHWDVCNIEYSAEASARQRPTRMEPRKPKPPEPLDPEAARAAIGNAERAFDDHQEDRVCGSKRNR
jgi:hypothetical protein